MCDVLLLSDEQEYRSAQGKDSHEPRHGRGSRNKGRQPCQQEVDYHAPRGKAFGHIHCNLLIRYSVDRIINSIEYNPVEFHELRKEIAAPGVWTTIYHSSKTLLPHKKDSLRLVIHPEARHCISTSIVPSKLPGFAFTVEIFLSINVFPNFGMKTTKVI